ncbi:hypothetical protein McanCB56680_006297 [Microsporum canis]
MAASHGSITDNYSHGGLFDYIHGFFVVGIDTGPAGYSYIVVVAQNEKIKTKAAVVRATGAAPEFKQIVYEF